MTHQLNDLLRQHLDETQMAKLERLQVLAAAFIAWAGVTPDKIELVEDHSDMKRVVYYFRVRQ